MEIANLAAGVTSLTNKEIETAVAALSFEVVAPFVIGAGGNAEVMDALLGGMQINLSKQDGNSTESLIQSLSVRDLAEISTHGESVIFLSDIGAGSWRAKFTLHIANNASLELSDRAKLMLALNSIPAASAVIIDGLDDANNTKSYIKYEAKFVNANVGKDFDIDAAYAMAVPVALITALEFTYINGKNIKLTQREVKVILANAQHSMYNRGGLVFFGYDKFAVISVEECLRVRVTLSASSNFYLLKNQSI